MVMANIHHSIRQLCLALLLGIACTAARAQFELPKAAAEGAGLASPPPAPTRLSYQYAYGMESPLTYRRDNDLDRGLRDNSLTFKSKVFASVLYRPTDWLAATLEMKLGHEWPFSEEPQVTLPNGDVKLAPRRQPTLLVEQVLLTLRQVIAPFEINLGRRNYEDDRHWVFDGSMDVVSLSYRHENVRAEAMVARDVLWSLDALRHTKKQRIESSLLSVDYRGFDNQVLAAYVLRRNDLSAQQGKPLMLGLRGNGKPSIAFNWWAEAALLRGSDEQGQRFKASGFDVGGTYRFADLPLDPNVTLALAYGSGDGNPGDGINHEFRQTGLQTNEAKYIGFSKFKAYGERLDSELSNMRIVTLGVGARLAPGTSIDAVYHRYWLDAPASEIRNWALTAQMNSLPGASSKDMGQALDLVIGFRGLLDIRRFGLDLRTGWFFPGRAFRRSDDGAPSGGSRAADKGLSVVAKFRY
jgi:hypothetical protein